MNPWELLRVSTFEAAASKARLAPRRSTSGVFCHPTGQEGAHPSEASGGSSSGGSVAGVPRHPSLADSESEVRRWLAPSRARRAGVTLKGEDMIDHGRTFC